MQGLRRIRTCLLVIAITSVCYSAPAIGQSSTPAKPDTQNAASRRDGQHDFDFEIGVWRTHVSRLLHPLTGSTTWVELEGTSVVHKIWDGRANMVELEADGPTGHFEGLNLRLYNPQSRQWSLNFANSASGSLSQPTIGEFTNGRGEFFDQETLNGRAILVRFVISAITPDSCRFEQAFSDDGGKTWEVNWIATDTRIKDEGQTTDMASAKIEAPTPANERNGQHDFDFELGAWKIRLSRLEHPLAGSDSWIHFDGTSVTQSVWNGRADLEQFETDGASGHIEGLTLRTYNPQSHQWSLYWANSKDGMLGQPMVGQFKNGRGEFFDQEAFNGKTIFVRYVWSEITATSAHFEQSFSDDGGKTWEVNWITDQTRVKEWI